MFYRKFYKKTTTKKRHLKLTKEIKKVSAASFTMSKLLIMDGSRLHETFSSNYSSGPQSGQMMTVKEDLSSLKLTSLIVWLSLLGIALLQRN